MTRDEAIAIRQKQLCGYVFAPLLLHEAIMMLKIVPPEPPPQKTGRKATGTSISAINKATARERALI